MNSLIPSFLIAMPQLSDPYFERSVVLLLEHSQDGALGLIINKPANITMGIFATQQNLNCQKELESKTLLIGGPLEPENGWILHSHEPIEEKKQILPGLYLSTSTESLETLLKYGQNPFQLILGYAGWEAGQLEDELKEGSWIMAQANKELSLNTESEQIWHKILKEMGVDPLKLAWVGGIH